MVQENKDPAINPVWIIMGVTGCGKTTIGKLWANELRIPFYDADDFHPAENIEKMSQGVALTDDDRFPWLEQLGALIIMISRNKGCVLACSALNELYRNYLKPGGHPVHFVYLKADKELIRKRIAGRKGHFMPDALIDSQFDALEEPVTAITIDASLTTDEILDVLREKFASRS
jgi:carbohydrate kinase (thermoresistant glucokinase family)